MLEQFPHATYGRLGISVYIGTVFSGTGEKPQLTAGVLTKEGRESSFQMLALPVYPSAMALDAVRPLTMAITKAFREENCLSDETSLGEHGCNVGGDSVNRSECY